jgi:hypothetical protein
MSQEIVYLNHPANYNSIIIKSKSFGEMDYAVPDMSTVDKIALVSGDINIESENGAGDPILWNRTGYAPGEIRFILAEESIDPGNYDFWVIIYFSGDQGGTVWTRVPFKIIAKPDP